MDKKNKKRLYTLDRNVACLMWRDCVTQLRVNKKSKRIGIYLVKEKKRKEKQKEKLYDLFCDVNLEPKAREGM